jgi:DNA (cytosine-5)-methyltransferase 1
VEYADDTGRAQQWGASTAGEGLAQFTDWWSVEPNVGRVAHGVPRRVDRIRGLGNAVVPQCAELIGKMLLQSIAES